MSPCLCLSVCMFISLQSGSQLAYHPIVQALQERIPHIKFWLLNACAHVHIYTACTQKDNFLKLLLAYFLKYKIIKYVML